MQNALGRDCLQLKPLALKQSVYSKKNYFQTFSMFPFVNKTHCVFAVRLGKVKTASVGVMKCVCEQQPLQYCEPTTVKKNKKQRNKPAC